MKSTIKNQNGALNRATYSLYEPEKYVAQLNFCRKDVKTSWSSISMQFDFRVCNFIKDKLHRNYFPLNIPKFYKFNILRTSVALFFLAFKIFCSEALTNIYKIPSPFLRNSRGYNFANKTPS